MRDWQTGKLEDLIPLLKNPKSSFELRAACDHKKKKFNLDGVTYCEICGEALEVTSYRD